MENLDVIECLPHLGFKSKLSAKVKRVALTFHCNEFENGGMCFEKLNAKRRIHEKNKRDT